MIPSDIEGKSGVDANICGSEPWLLADLDFEVSRRILGCNELSGRLEIVVQAMKSCEMRIAIVRSAFSDYTRALVKSDATSFAFFASWTIARVYPVRWKLVCLILFPCPDGTVLVVAMCAIAIFLLGPLYLII